MLRNIIWVGVALGKQCYFIASKHEGKLNTVNTHNKAQTQD